MFRRNVGLAIVAGIWFVGGPVLSIARAAAAHTMEAVAPNDNTRAAGVLADGTLTIRLRAAKGLWKPEGPGGPALSIEAFGEASSSLTVPALLIRVPEGTAIVVSIHNDLEASLHLNGLYARDGAPCPAVDVPPGSNREVQFVSGRAGTYHYWGTTMGAPIPFGELAGGFIVDPPGSVEPDRVLVRLINITPDDIFNVSLQSAEGPVTWTPITKDGAPVPDAESVAMPARQTIAVGETYFEYQPEGRKTLWLEVRTTAGKWQMQGQVIAK